MPQLAFSIEYAEAIGQVQACDQHYLTNYAVLHFGALYSVLHRNLNCSDIKQGSSRVVIGVTVPIDFCCVCGGRHDLSDIAACEGTSDVRQTLSASKMSKGASKDNISELKELVCSLTLEERKRETLHQIEELRLENELAETRREGRNICRGAN